MEARTDVDPGTGELLLTPGEAAGRLRVSVRTLERWRAHGTGPPYVVVGGRSVRYARSDLAAWIALRRRDAPQAGGSQHGD